MTAAGVTGGRALGPSNECVRAHRHLLWTVRDPV